MSCEQDEGGGSGGEGLGKGVILGGSGSGSDFEGVVWIRGGIESGIRIGPPPPSRIGAPLPKATYLLPPKTTIRSWKIKLYGMIVHVVFCKEMSCLRWAHIEAIINEVLSL